MKRILIILMALSFLDACATNPITEQNFKINKKPMGTIWSYVTGAIPGLTQLLDGEYLEAGIYAGSTIAPILVSQSMLTPDPNNPDQMIVKPSREIYFNILTGLSFIPFIWSYVDGVYSTAKYNKQWKSLASKYVNKKINESEVTYMIIGSAPFVDITLTNGNGGTEQFTNIALPYFISYRTFASDYLYISAQNQGKAGSVTVKIFYKGRLYKTSTSSGAYVIATASTGKPE